MTVYLYGWGPIGGRAIQEKGFRNGVAPPGPALRDLARYASKILAHRQKVVFRRDIHAGAAGTHPDCYDQVANATTWRARFYTSPGMNQLRARYVLIPTDDTLANAASPQARWTTTPDGGGATTQPWIYQTQRITAGAASDPSQWRIVDQAFTGINPDTFYQATLEQQDKLRIASCVIYEVPRESLDTATDTYVVDQSKFGVLAPIYDRDALDLLQTVTRLYKRQGTNFFSYTRPSNVAYTRTGSTTAINVLDSTTGAWAANSAGFPCDGRYHGAIETYNSGTNRETVPVHLWAVVGITGGATATVTFRDQNATIGTLTTTSTGANWVTTNTTWTAPSNATMKVDVMLATSDAGQTASLYAAGMFHYEA